MTGAVEKKRLSTGTILDDRFEIVEFLGAGSFGEVYRARQIIFGRAFRQVALKLFAEGTVTAENAYEVLNDAIVLAGLQEEHQEKDAVKRIVQVYDMGIVKTPAPRAFMSMKLIPGKKTLKSEIRRFAHGGGMPVSLSLRYLRQMLMPLGWLHSMESAVVHGDLKPENVLFTEESDLVVTDFGLAARMPIGTLGGTIAYNAPEKLLGMPAGPEADVYAVGIMWYEMLTGRHPFEHVGIEATAQGDKDGYTRAHLEARKWPICAEGENGLPPDGKRIEPASDLNHELSEQHPQLDAVLRRCMAYDISKRYPNARVLLSHIDQYIQSGHLASHDIDHVIEMTSPSNNPSGAEARLQEKSVEDTLADAGALIKQGKPDRALQLAEGLLGDNPNDVAVLLVKSRALAGLAGRLEEAAHVCAQAQKLAPGHPDVFEVRADILDARGKPAQAQTFRVKAAALRRTGSRTNERRY
jgi:serine/threonine protein kinase